MIKQESLTENKAIGRAEIVFTISHEGKPQPSRKELESLLKVKIKEKFFVIIKIESRFGKPESKVLVHSYKKEETMMHYEPKHLFNRSKEEKKEEPKPAPVLEETKTQKPEKKEETFEHKTEDTKSQEPKKDEAKPEKKESKSEQKSSVSKGVEE